MLLKKQPSSNSLIAFFVPRLSPTVAKPFLVADHNHVLALLLPQSFYLLMKLHTDVCRYFIDDALFMALNTEQNSNCIGWGLVGWVSRLFNLYVHVPLMDLKVESALS